MKSLKYFFLAGAGLLLASCSQQDIENPDIVGDATLSLTVNLPQDDNFRTRDGETTSSVDALRVLVFYDNGNSNYTPAIAEPVAVDFKNGSANLNLDLVSGKSYLLAMFASSSIAFNGENPVYSIGNNGVMTVNYNSMTLAGNQAGAYDCFYNAVSTGKITATVLTKSVELTRPVAQVNWGATDLSSVSSIFGEGGQDIQSRLTVNNPYTTLDLTNGTVGGQQTSADGETNKVMLPAFGIQSGAYPAEGVSAAYIAAQYLLVPAEGANLNLSLWVANAGNENLNSYTSVTDDVETIEVKPNYQTNIYGSLLSGEQTTITPAEWENGYNPAVHWDGKSSTTPEVNTTNKSVTLNTASDLAGLADIINGNNDDYSAEDIAGYTVNLEADFDMGGYDFPMIGSAVRSGAATTTGTNSFSGVFDGQGHTISNLTINGTPNGDAAAGFIGNLDGATSVLKDLNFDNLEINAANNEQAGVVGIVTNGASVSGVTVSSGSVKSKEAAGGIVGRILANGSVNKCSNGATISATSYNCGGIVGAAYYTQNGTAMTISECENTGDIISPYGAGGIVGLSCANVDKCNNSGSVTGTQASIGGVVGEQRSAGSVTNCTNSGVVVGGTSSNNYGAGGIVGWVRYVNDNYPRQNIIVVANNTNTADISGPTGVGGIVGVWYQCGECYSNINTSKSLSGEGSFIAGIVGNSQWTGVQPTNLGDDDKYPNNLFVQNNYSNTPESAMKGHLAVPFVYINNSKTIAAGNSMTEQEVIENNFTPATQTSGNSWSDWPAFANPAD